MSGHEEVLRPLMAEAGVHQYGLVETAEVPFYEEIRRICEGNVCRCYGTTWACPPATGTFEACREQFLSYRRGIVFSGKYPLRSAMDYRGMMEGHRGFKELCDRVYLALSPLWPEHLLLSNESCVRCETCTYPDAPCRMPERLFPALEGYGVNVAQLARAAGLRCREEDPSVLYFGMFLFDMQ